MWFGIHRGMLVLLSVAQVLYFAMISIPEPKPQSFELAKWIAVVTMVIDHYGKIVDQDVLVWTHWIGRAAFPLFFWIIASRLADRPDAAKGYVRSLLPWALVSQPVGWR